MAAAAAVQTCRSSSCASLVSKGAQPERSMKASTPRLHTSTGKAYCEPMTWCRLGLGLGLGPRLGLGLELELDVDVAGTSERDENATGDGDLERRRPRQVDQR